MNGVSNATQQKIAKAVGRTSLHLEKLFVIPRALQNCPAMTTSLVLFLPSIIDLIRLRSSLTYLARPVGGI